jgi:hypothetical protein
VWLADFHKQVIHISTHRYWGQVLIRWETSPQKAKKNRDLSKNRLLRCNWLFFDQKLAGHVIRSVQEIANTLSTEAQTDFGGNFGRTVENR